MSYLGHTARGAFRSAQRRTTLCCSSLGVAFSSPIVIATTCTPRFSTTAEKNRKDCPLCQKFGRGPCGDLFYAWLECTDANPDDATNQCAMQFNQFQACLEREEDYYSREQKGKDDDVEEADNKSELLSEDFRTAWEELIREDLNEVERKEFPGSLRPLN